MSRLSKKIISFLLILPLYLGLICSAVHAEDDTTMTADDYKANTTAYDGALKDLGDAIQAKDDEIKAKQKEIDKVSAMGTTDPKYKSLVAPLKQEQAALEKEKTDLELKQQKFKQKKETAGIGQEAATFKDGAKDVGKDCLENPTPECAEEQLDADTNGTVANKYKTAQDELHKCYTTQSTKSDVEKAVCDAWEEVVADLGIKIAKLKLVKHSGDSVPSNKILAITNQAHFANADAFLGGVIDLLISFIGLVAFILLVIGGFRLLIAMGNDNEIQKAKVMITSSLIGLVVALLAYVIVAVVQGVIYG